MTDIFLSIGAGIAALIAATFVVGFVKTLLEGPEGIAFFDRAGFTVRNFWNGTVPSAGTSESSTEMGDSAEMEFVDGKLVARPTRTIVKLKS